MRKSIKNKTLKLKRTEVERFINGIKEMKDLMANIGWSKMIVKIRTERNTSLENRLM